MRSLPVLPHVLTCHQKANFNIRCACIPVSACRHKWSLVTLTAQPQGLVLLWLHKLFWQHAFFTYFPTSDFDQTWSKWPVPEPLLTRRQWWGQRSRWRHSGQKGWFWRKMLLLLQITRYGHVTQVCWSAWYPLQKLSFCSLDLSSIKGSEVKMWFFSKFSKCFFPFRLRGIVTWLMHTNHLDTLHKSYGPKKSPGVKWGHRGQNIVFAQNNVQNASPPTDYVAWSRDSCTWISITPSQKVMVLKNHKGSVGVTEVKTLFLHKTF